jgi:hypothetical protein
MHLHLHRHPEPGLRRRGQAEPPGGADRLAGDQGFPRPLDVVELVLLLGFLFALGAAAIVVHVLLARRMLGERGVSGGLWLVGGLLALALVLVTAVGILRWVRTRHRAR